VLAMFFGGVADIPTEYQSDVCKNGVKPQKSAIWWYESSILLLMYVGYVIVMKFNEKMRLRLDKSLDLVASIDSPRLSVMEEKNPTLADERPGKVEVSVEKGDGNSQKKNRARTGFAGFRAGMLTMLLDSRQVNSAAIAALHRIKGDVKETFDKLDQSHDGYIDKAELASLLEGLGLNMQGQKDDGVDQMLLDISEVATQWDGTRPNEVSLGEFTDWYVKSEQRVEGELSAAFSRCDADGNGLLNREEVEAVMKKMGNELSKTEFNTAFTDLDLDHSGDVSVEEFSKWYKESAFFEERHQLQVRMHVLVSCRVRTTCVYQMAIQCQLACGVIICVQQQEVEEEEGVSLSIPEGTAAKVKFFIILPLLLFMSFTMPDVRKVCSCARMRVEWDWV
jgi:Ca2+-binding EF-hand superfamily protein